MVSTTVRHCDLCEDVIQKGERYAACLVPMRNVPSVREVVSAGTLDMSGNLRLDFCVDCRLSMILANEELVN